MPTAAAAYSTSPRSQTAKSDGGDACGGQADAGDCVGEANGGGSDSMGAGGGAEDGDAGGRGHGCGGAPGGFDGLARALASSCIVTPTSCPPEG